jgi:hypothetical protein
MTDQSTILGTQQRRLFLLWLYLSSRQP